MPPTSYVDREQLEATLVANLPAIEKMARALCRRYGLPQDEADDFVASVHVKMVQDDYAVLQKFRGQSLITTYLAVVIAMEMREYRVKKWGRWRPSAAAMREGPVATRLESLIHRQGLTLAAAGNVLRSSGETTQSDRELGLLLARLPRREPLRGISMGADPLVVVSSEDSADDTIVREARTETQQATERALGRVLDGLSVEDRLIVRMRFWEGMSVADISRALNLPQKPIYRRLDRLLVHIRRELEAAGVVNETVRELLVDPAD